MSAFILISTMLSTNVVFGIGSNSNLLFIFGQTNQSELDVSDTLNLEELKIEKVRVGDIDIAYKMFGKGNPLLLINGWANTLDYWHPNLLEKLASNHTIITFNNRGVGNTTSGDKTFTIKQFAQDTSGLLDALKIKKTDVLGFSMGGRIAQELVLAHPEKIGKLIIYASSCGGKQSIPPTSEVLDVLDNQSIATSHLKQILQPLLYPEEWRAQNPSYVDDLPKSTEIVSDRTVELQQQAIVNWSGVCDRLNKIAQPTLVIVGTEDNLAPPDNSLLISNNIPGAWHVQIQGAGHQLAMQYPEKLSNIVLLFLES